METIGYINKSGSVFYACEFGAAGAATEIDFHGRVYFSERSDLVKSLKTRGYNVTRDGRIKK